MTVPTHPPCTIKIPSVERESECVVIGGVGRGIHHLVCTYVLNNVNILPSVCTCTYVGVLWGAHSSLDDMIDGITIIIRYHYIEGLTI